MPADEAAPRIGSDMDTPTKPVRPPPRPSAEILRDIETERAGLTEAVATLRRDVDAARAKILSKRTLGIVAGSIATLVMLRRRMRRHRSRS